MIVKDTMLNDLDDIISFLKDNGVIQRNDPHKYELQARNTIESQSKEEKTTVQKAILCVIAFTLATIGMCFISSWTLLLFAPLTLLSYLWLLFIAISEGLSATTGGYVFERIKYIKKRLQYTLRDEYVSLSTSSHDYGNTIVFPSEEDFNNICNLVVPENMKYHIIKETNMKPGDVSGWESTIEIYVPARCISIKNVFY